MAHLQILSRRQRFFCTIALPAACLAVLQSVPGFVVIAIDAVGVCGGIGAAAKRTGVMLERSKLLFGQFEWHIPHRSALDA